MGDICPIHHVPRQPNGTCPRCLVEYRGRVPRRIQGREQVGVRCEQMAHCANEERCRAIYTQDMLNWDGSCPHFLAKDAGESR